METSQLQGSAALAFSSCISCDTPVIVGLYFARLLSGVVEALVAQDHTTPDSRPFGNL